MVNTTIENISTYSGVNKDTNLWDVNLSCRLHNSLKAIDLFSKDSKVGDLAEIKISELKGIRNFGNKSLSELSEICAFAGIKMKP